MVDLPSELVEKHFCFLDTFPPCSYSELDFLFQIGRADRHTHRKPVCGVSYLMEERKMEVDFDKLYEMHSDLLDCILSDASNEQDDLYITMDIGWPVDDQEIPF